MECALALWRSVEHRFVGCVDVCDCGCVFGRMWVGLVEAVFGYVCRAVSRMRVGDAFVCDLC